MKVAGIICEYNPFHRGHAAHMAMTREALGPDTGIVCVMGGNFVQRGEPAVLPKHARAEMAVRGGANLVLELPVPWAIASAERFAMGGVSVLNACGLVDTLSFGSECGDTERLRRVADVLLCPEADGLIRRELETGVSYATAREKAASALIGSDASLLREPNNILGIEYLKALERLGASMAALTVPRVAVDHDGGALGGYASASHIRERLLKGGDVSAYMLPAAVDILHREISAGRAPVTMAAAEPMLLYRLRTMTDGEFAQLPDSGEGLGARLAQFARSEPSYEQILEKTKTKRYAHARLRRMALAALLGVTGEMQKGLPPYIRVLAFDERGRELLRRMKETAALPIIVKPAAARALPAKAREIFELEAQAGDIYALLSPGKENRAGGGEWTRSPWTLLR